MSSSRHESGDSDPPDWFSDRQRLVKFDRQELLRFAARLRRLVAGGKEFAVCIASDNAVRKACQRFLGKNRTTDVLSFPEDDASRLGDILISAPQARRQARQLGHSVTEELKVLLLHGVLHLAGYDHETDGGRMRRVEQS